MFEHLNDIIASNDKILKLLKDNQNSEVNEEGFFYYNEQDVKDMLRRYEDELKHIVEATHQKWKENLNAGKDVPDLIYQCLTLG